MRAASRAYPVGLSDRLGSDESKEKCMHRNEPVHALESNRQAIGSYQAFTRSMPD